MASNNQPSIRIHRLFSNSPGNCAGLSRLKSNDSPRAKGDVFTFSTVFSCCPLIGPWIVNYYLCIRVLTQLLIRHFPFFLFFFFSIPRSSCEIFTSSLRNEVLNTETSNQSYSHIRCFSIKIFLLFFPEKASIEKETRIEKIIKMLRFFLLLF